MLFGSTQQLNKFPLESVPIGTASISPSENVRNLGEVQDLNMTMTPHVSKICSSAYLYLRDIGRIPPFLSQDTTKRLVPAFVTSRLDMSNVLLYRISQSQIQRLRRIQHSATRVITKADRHDHVKPVLQQLHWLPVEQRIKYSSLSRSMAL